MRLSLSVLALTALSGCAGGSLYTTLAGSSSVAPSDAYSCAEKQLQTLEYRRTQYDNKALFIIGEKRNDEEAGSGTTFRKTVDILEVYLKASASGTADLTVKARTFDELGNTQGIVREERKSSNRVLADARKLGQACAS
jgi:hypothetical protein